MKPALHCTVLPAYHLRGTGSGVLGNTYVLTGTVNLRAAASTRGERLGAVESGTTFQALGRTGDGKWILVGQDGVGVGYVSSAYVYRA